MSLEWWLLLHFMVSIVHASKPQFVVSPFSILRDHTWQWEHYAAIGWLSVQLLFLTTIVWIGLKVSFALALAHTGLSDDDDVPTLGSLFTTAASSFENLPTTNPLDAEEWRCSICHSRKLNDCVKMPNCPHIMHRECLLAWVRSSGRKSCVYCRQ
jgi:hypothetical protein